MKISWPGLNDLEKFLDEPQEIKKKRKKFIILLSREIKN